MTTVDTLQKISDTVWELPASYKEGMRVPARIIATEKLVREMDEAVYQQISNVATLPGITRHALCMPDGHSGYGFPIGGVAAMDVHQGGVISPGGIGFDINCGMRLVTTNLTLQDVQPRLKEIVDRLFERVPAGVGTHGFLKLSHSEFRDLVEQGAQWCVEHDFGWQEDLELTPTTDVYADYHKGKKPPAVATPKIETLIERYKPTIVIVQLGTNWMDQTLSDDYIRHVLARFVGAVHGDGTRRMIWIGPPDSSRFSKVQNRIYRLIQQSLPRGDPVIDSRRFTRYVMGKTGGDGIHYNRESGEAWAKPVNASLDQILAPDIAVRRKLVSNR